MRALLLLLLLGEAAAHRGHGRRNLFGKHLLSHAKEAEHKAEHGFHDAKGVAKDVVHDAEKWVDHHHDDHDDGHVSQPAPPRQVPAAAVDDTPATAVAVAEPAQDEQQQQQQEQEQQGGEVPAGAAVDGDSPYLFEALGVASPLAAVLLAKEPVDPPYVEETYGKWHRSLLAEQEIRRRRQLAAQDLLPPASQLSAILASPFSGISAISGPRARYIDSETAAVSRASDSELRSMAAEFAGYRTGGFGPESQYIPTITDGTIDTASGISGISGGSVGRYDDEMLFGDGVSGAAGTTAASRPGISDMADAVLSGTARGFRSDFDSSGGVDVAGGGSDTDSGSAGLATSVSFREGAAMALDPESPLFYHHRPLPPPPATVTAYMLRVQRPTNMLQFIVGKVLSSGIGFISRGSEDSSGSSSSSTTTLTTTSDTDGGAISSFSDVSAMSTDSDADIAGSGGSALVLELTAFERAVHLRMGVVQVLAAMEAMMGPSPGEEESRPTGCGGFLRLAVGSGAGGVGVVDIGSSGGGGGHGSGGFSEMSRSSDSDSTSDDWSYAEDTEASYSDPFRAAQAALSAAVAMQTAEAVRMAQFGPIPFPENSFAETSFADKYSDDGITVEGGTICRCANGKWNIFVEPELLDAPSACPRLCGDIDASEIDESGSEWSFKAELAAMLATAAMVAAATAVVLTVALVAASLLGRRTPPGDQDGTLSEPLLEPVAGTVGSNTGAMTPQAAFASAPADPMLV